MGPGDFGTAIHDGLEQFLLEHKEAGADQSLETLTQFLKQAFEIKGYADFEIAKEPEYAGDAIDTLKKLIVSYDKDTTAYYSQPRIQYTHDYGEFDDLARRSEWASLGRDYKS